MFTEQELQNLIVIVSTHPTPEGVGSQQGQIKIALVNKLSKMIEESKSLEKKKEVKTLNKV